MGLKARMDGDSPIKWLLIRYADGRRKGEWPRLIFETDVIKFLDTRAWQALPHDKEECWQCSDAVETRIIINCKKNYFVPNHYYKL